jgi:signal transduction histidine kinase/ActR/RegA family two-component response regulator
LYYYCFIFRGAGDFHQSKYDYLKQSIVLTGGGLYTKNSPIYELELYPNDNFYDGYSTNNPMVATIAAVASILLISGFFFLYDFFVRREFLAKKNLLDAKRQFMRFVSHEVRTPLNSVCMGLTVIQTELAASLGYSSPTDVQLLRGGELSTDSKDDSSKGAILEWFQLLQEIQSNAQIAVDVLSDLLNYDKIEQGNSSLELTALPICQLIERTTNEFRLPAAKKNIALQFRILVGNSSGGEEEEEEEEAAPPNEEEEGLPQHFRELKLIGDAFRVTQALRNLISNAIKFTPEQGTVHVEAVWWKSSDVNNTHVFTSKRGKEVAVESNGSIQVRVKDSGVGLSEEQVQNLFRDGIQFDVNELQAGQGSGLGLFIAKGIVQQHQGSLEADSEGKGLGTTFTITLPVYNLQETPAKNKNKNNTAENINNDGTTEDQTQRSDTSKPSLPLRILIVDDVSSNRKLLHRLLKRKGHICEDAENGAVAVGMVVKAVMDGNPFDIVLMDNEMPEMTGPEAAAAIRAEGSDVFIVGITGNLLPEDVAHFQSRGASAVMSKPFNMDDLEERWMEYKKCTSVAKILGDGSTSAASLRCEDKKEVAARPA